MIADEHKNKNSLPLALSAGQLAQRLGVSERHLRRMTSGGHLPRPFHIGRLVRWSVTEIDAWIAAGAPSRKQWEVMKEVTQ